MVSFQNNLKEALKIESVDSSSGVLFPYYDSDTSVVYLAGKVEPNTTVSVGVKFFKLSIMQKRTLNYETEH